MRGAFRSVLLPITRLADRWASAHETDDYDAHQIADEHIEQIAHQAARDDQSIGVICRSYEIAEATLLPLTQEVRRDDP